MTDMRTLLIALLLVLPNTAAAQETWTLTTADFRNAPVTLKAIDGKSVRVTDTAGGNERAVSIDDFLQLDRPSPPTAQQGKFALHLSAGDRVAGEPVALAGENLVWASALAGELRVPMSRIVALTRAGQPPPDGRTNEDVVSLSNGDALRGIIAGIEGGKVLVQQPDAAEPTAVPIDSIGRISFAATGAPMADPGASSFRIRLADGSALPARAVTLADGKLSADLGDGKPRPIDLTRVAAIEQVNGPAAWLSGRLPSESSYVPFFGTGQEYPARMDASVDGSRDLRFGGQTFRRALGVHSRSTLTWPLDSSHAAFRTQYAVDERLPLADMTVRVRIGDRVVHEQKSVRAGTLSPVIVVDLTGAKSLTLEVDYGSGADVQDRLVWLEPALLKKMPATMAPAAPTSAPALPN